jgi:hypothetical protein
MRLADLLAAGGIVPDDLVKREVVWDNGVAEVSIKRMGYGEVEKAILSRTADQTSNSAWLIASCVYLDDGNERLSYDQAYWLHPSLFKALSEAVTEVNDMGKTARSPLTKKSGTNSSLTASVGGQSPKQKRR